MQAVFSRSRLQVAACSAPAVDNSSAALRLSRIGARPIPLPKGVDITIDGKLVKVKGPKGELQQLMPPLVVVVKEEGKLLVKREKPTKEANAYHGLARSLAANMVTGVSEGFEKKMEMVGTGYRASVSGKELTLNVGYSKPRILEVPAGLKVAVEKNTGLTISGSNKVDLGDFCAKIRAQRPPEPYKGKGIRYAGEFIKLKEGKSGRK